MISRRKFVRRVLAQRVRGHTLDRLGWVLPLRVLDVCVPSAILAQELERRSCNLTLGLLRYFA